MGAEQSSNRGAGAQAQAAPQKTCYYELLSVERTATDEEIKKAYRRKALELHPDRNLDDVANATRKFAEVQTAYEVLSDPQERAWYDSHRDDILRGDSGTDDAAAGGDTGPRYYNNVRLTPTEELFTLMGRFNSSVPFDDSPSGFFGILEATFAQLALEEEAASSWDGASNSAPIQYPPFGGAADDYETVAKPFYRDWAGFATAKSFSWKDKYRLSDAPDRAVRRLMEKENKKGREQAARDFNDAVRSLVAFVRKRDPRYVPNAQSEAERQQALRDSAAAQAARQRAANQERLRSAQAAAAAYVPPVWAQRRPEDGEADEHEGGFSSDAESEVQHEIECVVCNKSFKSEKQFEAHEKSKKHVKAVQQLRRQMKKENKDFHLDAEPTTQRQPPEEEEDDDEVDGEEVHADEAKEEEDHAETKGEEPIQGDREGEEEEEDSEEDGDEDDEYAPREVVEKRFKTGQQLGDDSDEEDEADGLAEELGDLDVKDRQATANGAAAEKKVGKAKAKREKKAARQAAAAVEGTDTNAKCKVCHESFTSNTKLHKHLRQAHPAPAPASRTAKSGGKKKKG